MTSTGLILLSISSVVFGVGAHLGCDNSPHCQIQSSAHSIPVLIYRFFDLDAHQSLGDLL
jgi:hypothetical protein